MLAPSVFTDRAIFCGAEPPGAPAPRTPLIVYPAAPTDCQLHVAGAVETGDFYSSVNIGGTALAPAR